MAHYDIPTLLSLRSSADININRFTDNAFDCQYNPSHQTVQVPWTWPGTSVLLTTALCRSDNLLRRHKQSRSISSEQLVNRPSRLSSFSHKLENASVRETYSTYPSRHPHEPPGSTLSQSSLGFARFLEDHTSPRHQRVTASGQVIPTESPETPVHKVRFPLRIHDRRDDDDDLRAPVRDKPKATSEGMSTPLVTAGYRLIDLLASYLPSGLLPDLPVSNTFDAGSLEQTGQLDKLGVPQMATPNPSGWSQEPGLHFALNTGQQPMQPDQQSQIMDVPTQPDRSAYGFSQEEFAWLSSLYSASLAQNPSMRHQSQGQQQTLVAAAQSEASASNNISTGSILSFSPAFDPNSCLMPQWQYSGSLAPVSNNQPCIMPTTFKEPPHHSRLLQAQRQHEVLTAQLSRIDRHMALHTWDLDPHSKTLLVEQRKSLVRELDALRLYIEQMEMMPMTARITPSSDHNPLSFGTPTPVGATYVPGGVAGSQPLLASQLPMPNIMYGMQHLPAPLLNTISAFDTAEGSGDTSMSWQDVAPSDYYEDSNRTATPTGYGTTEKVRNVPSVEKANPPKLSLKAPSHATNLEAGNNDRLSWATPTRSSPPDLRKLYNRIEEANKRGDNIEDLLKELSLVTTEMLRQRREEHNKSTQRIVTGEKFGQAKGTSRSITETSEVAGENIHPKRYGRRPWAAEFFPREQSHIQREPSSTDTEAGVSNFSSSQMSTDDSWDSLRDTKWVPYSWCFYVLLTRFRSTESFGMIKVR